MQVFMWIEHGIGCEDIIVILWYLFCVRECVEKKYYETYYRSARVQVWTISRYSLTISNNFLGLSRRILVYFGLSWSISVHLGASWSISVFLDLSRTILNSEIVYIKLTCFQDCWQLQEAFICTTSKSLAELHSFISGKWVHVYCTMFVRTNERRTVFV